MSYEEDSTAPNRPEDSKLSEQAAKEQEGLHAPKPSYWPFILAVGLTLAFGGMLLHPAVVAVGAVIALAAIVAWGVEPH